MHELLGGRHGAAAGKLRRLSRVMYFLLTLGAGVMLGIFLTLLLLSHLRISILSPSAIRVASLRHGRGVLDNEQSVKDDQYLNQGKRQRPHRQEHERKLGNPDDGQPRATRSHGGSTQELLVTHDLMGT